MEDQERGRANAGSSDAEPCGANVGGNKGSIFGPGRPPQVERMAHALRLHRGNVGDLWMQLRSLSHELDDRLEGFAGEARAAASHIGGLIDVILEAAASDKLDSVVRCACLQDRRCRGGRGVRGSSRHLLGWWGFVVHASVRGAAGGESAACWHDDAASSAGVTVGCSAWLLGSCDIAVLGDWASVAEVDTPAIWTEEDRLGGSGNNIHALVTRLI